MSKGTIRLSLDFECGWGVVPNGSWRAPEAAGVYRDLRSVLRRFVKRLDELELSFTWAVVGGMIEDPETRDTSHLKGKFGRDMSIFLKEADQQTFDGRDLLDMVLAMQTRQSFASHTYTHLLFSDAEQNDSVVEADLALSVKVNQQAGLEVSRLVFPQNHVGRLEVVSRAGFSYVRMPPTNTVDPTDRPGPLLRAVSLATRPIASVYEEQHSSGLTLHYASELLNWGAGSSPVKRYLVRRRIEKALIAAKNGENVHFWMHPFDLVQTGGLENYMQFFLMEVASLRDCGCVEIKGF